MSAYFFTKSFVWPYPINGQQHQAEFCIISLYESKEQIQNNFCWLAYILYNSYFWLYLGTKKT